MLEGADRIAMRGYRHGLSMEMRKYASVCCDVFVTFVEIANLDFFEIIFVTDVFRFDRT